MYRYLFRTLAYNVQTTDRLSTVQTRPHLKTLHLFDDACYDRGVKVCRFLAEMFSE